MNKNFKIKKKKSGFDVKLKMWRNTDILSVKKVQHLNHTTKYKYHCVIVSNYTSLT